MVAPASAGQNPAYRPTHSPTPLTSVVSNHRRTRRRGARIRENVAKLEGVTLSVTDDPQSTKAWDTGAIGEKRLGHKLTEVASGTVRILHDRRVPGPPSAHQPHRRHRVRRLPGTRGWRDEVVEVSDSGVRR